jgi:hypothetical protein
MKSALQPALMVPVYNYSVAKGKKALIDLNQPIVTNLILFPDKDNF